jgi:hypothetical protein
VHRGPAPAAVGIVEAGHVVVDEARAVDDLDGGRRGVRQRRRIVAAGDRHRERELRPDPGAAGKQRVVERGGEPRGRRRGGGGRKRGAQGSLDTGGWVHERLLGWLVSGAVRD